MLKAVYFFSGKAAPLFYLEKTFHLPYFLCMGARSAEFGKKRELVISAERLKNFSSAVATRQIPNTIRISDSRQGLDSMQERIGYLF